MGRNDTRAVSPGGTTPGESFSPGVILSSNHSVLVSLCPKFIPGQNDSRGVILSLNGTIPGESFSAGETTPGESFCPGIERPQGSHSVLGWNDFRGVIVLG